MNKFNETDLVLYKNGSSFELGVVKKVWRTPSHKWNNTTIGSWGTHEETLTLWSVDNKAIVQIEITDLQNLTDEEILEYLDDRFEEYTYKEEYKYFVWYHTGDTAALTNERDLYKLENEYAFLVMRRKADTSSINETPAREFASDIIDKIMHLTGKTFGLDLNDHLTEYVNKYQVPIGTVK